LRVALKERINELVGAEYKQDLNKTCIDMMAKWDTEFATKYNEFCKVVMQTSKRNRR
jgi:hypothetical protein